VIPALVVAAFAGAAACLCVASIEARRAAAVRARLPGAAGATEIGGAGAAMDGGRWRALMPALLAVLAAAAVAASLAGPAAGVAVTAVGAALAGYAHVSRRRRRIAALVDALPMLVDRLMQHLAAGHSVANALQRGISGLPPDLREMLIPAVIRLQGGETPAAALGHVARRLGVRELRMIALAISANARYGGSLSRILANLVRQMRDQDRTRREFAALSAETRATSWVLVALPLLVAGALLLVNPAHFRFFVVDPLGRVFGVLAGGGLAGGLWVMRRLRRIDA